MQHCRQLAAHAGRGYVLATSDAGSALLLAHHRLEGILHQHRHRHRTNAAGHGCDPRGASARRFKINIAAEVTVLEPVHADINNDSTGAYPRAGNELRLANRNDQHVGQLYVLLQPLRKAMRDGCGGAHRPRRSAGPAH